MVPSKNAVENTIPLERSVFYKIQDAPLTKSYLQAVKRTPVENFGNILLPKFDAAIKCGVSLNEGTATSQEALISYPVPTTKVNRAGGGKWGPVIPTRMSNRIKRDGKPSLIKAQEIKQVQNLEIPKGNKSKAFQNS